MTKYYVTLKNDDDMNWSMIWKADSFAEAEQKTLHQLSINFDVESKIIRIEIDG